MLWQFPELYHLTQDLFAIDLHAVVDRPQRTSLDADALLDVTDSFHGILVLVFKVSERQAKVLAECRNIGVGILAEQVLFCLFKFDLDAVGVAAPVIYKVFFLFPQGDQLVVVVCYRPEFCQPRLSPHHDLANLFGHKRDPSRFPGLTELSH